MTRKKKEDSSFAPRLTAPGKSRSISRYENNDGVRPASVEVVMVPAQTLHVSADEPLRLEPRFPVVTQLPEKDQRAVLRLIDSLTAIAAPRGAQGEQNGR